MVVTIELEQCCNYSIIVMHYCYVECNILLPNKLILIYFLCYYIIIFLNKKQLARFELYHRSIYNNNNI